MVPRAGLEPARANAHQILSLARLPIPPPRHHMLKKYINVIVMALLDKNNVNQTSYIGDLTV